jgi:hypothetical protein
MSCNTNRTEIRFEIPLDELAVLDGYCQGTGQDRTHVLKSIIGDWSVKQLHVSTLICRVAGVNPADSEGHRIAGRALTRATDLTGAAA